MTARLGPAALLRWLDFVVLAVALPVFVLTDLPILGWAATVGAWCLQRGIQLWVEHRAGASRDPRTVAGLMAGSLIARGWLVALTIFAVGLAVEDRAGLSAAVLFLAVLTVYFTMQIVRPEDPRRST